ncbi:hypothetical protein [Microbacterium arborescens]|uniref:hypothetical protein n=1 Tax=Microbacterium arborescens TaxID=33883 RepID=UPI003C72771A
MTYVITDSAGYEGTVDEPQWSDLLAMSGGRQYGVGSSADWTASVGGADREVRLTPGRGFGYGVRDKTTEEASLLLPATASGSVWHLICVHRDWQANQSTFETLPGSNARAIPVRETTPGEVDDQPLWLARVDAGKSQVQELVDLRVWGGDGGSLAANDLVLQYLNRLGTSVRYGDMLAMRIRNAQGSPVWKRFDLTEDTKWVDATRNPGWSWGWCQVRRIGAIVFFRISASRAQGWGPDNNLALLPERFRPSVATYVNSTHANGGKREFKILTNGRVDASEGSGGATGVTLTGSFPV